MPSTLSPSFKSITSCMGVYKCPFMWRDFWQGHVNIKLLLLSTLWAGGIKNFKGILVQDKGQWGHILLKNILVFLKFLPSLTSLSKCGSSDVCAFASLCCTSTDSWLKTAVMVNQNILQDSFLSFSSVTQMHLFPSNIFKIPLEICLPVVSRSKSSLITQPQKIELV